MKTFEQIIQKPGDYYYSGSRRLELPDIRSRIRNPFWVISAVIFLMAFSLLLSQSGGVMGVLLLLLPLTFGPMIVSLILGAAVGSQRSLLTLLISNILYSFGVLWAYFHAFYFYPDPQAGLVFLFVGIYSLPVMIPMWIAAVYCRHHKSI